MHSGSVAKSNNTDTTGLRFKTSIAAPSSGQCSFEGTKLQHAVQQLKGPNKQLLLWPHALASCFAKIRPADNPFVLWQHAVVAFV